MHLKRLQLTGFKTFADRTEILFSPGVTAIVGPNGSGKSNIADAVLWALGEQKASAVRGVRNQDVIFNGSARRKQTGLAEVSLTVDNSDGTLPLSFEEVTVTRRALRSGDSEYFINKSACRLKDIYELFLDTGVGREAYALVNQSEIDAVLTAAPESRRGLFEEAAGIKKYRVKKREALRKLEATELNLSRITDILSEIESQLAPLHVAAQLALRYIALKDQLTRIEENYLINELRAADEAWLEARQGREADEALAQTLSEELAACDIDYARITGEADEAEHDLNRFRSLHQELHTRNERLHNDRSIAVERLQALSVQRELHQRELDDLLPRLSAADQSVIALEAEASETGELSRDHKTVQNEGEHLLDTLNRQIKEIQTLADRHRQEAEALLSRKAAEEAECIRAESRLAEARAAVSLLVEERQRLSAELTALDTTVEEAETANLRAEADIAQSLEKVTAARDTRARSNEAVAAARLRHETIRGEGLSISVRLKSLRGLEDAQEGYFAGVKSVLNAAKSGHLRGRYTVVADAFRAPSHLVTALDIAFGASLQDIITSTEQEAKAAIDHLKRGSFGRATFLPLDRMRQSRSDQWLPSRNQPGYLGTAIELIDFDQEVRAALDALVGRVLICETIDDALSLSTAAFGWSRIVTLAGEVIVPSGAITGGSVQRRGGSLLDRKTEISRLGEQLSDRKLAEVTAERKLSEAVVQLELAEEFLAEMIEGSSVRRLNLSGAKQFLDNAKRTRMSISDRADAHNRRLESAMELVRNADAKLTSSRERLESIAVPSFDAADYFEITKLAEMIKERDDLSAQILQERIARAALEEKSTGLDRALRLARQEVGRLRAQQERRTAQIEQVTSDRKSIEQLLQSIGGVIEQSDFELVEADQTLLIKQERRQKLAADVVAAATLIRELQNAKAGALAAIRKNELAEARCEIVRQQAAMKLLEEYDVTADVALSLLQSPEVTPDSPREVTRLRREIKALGDVNVGAAEEFEKLSERFAHMTAQKNDAQLAKDKVYEAIREIDESTRDVFMSTFLAVESAFQTVFQRLFSGGAAQLKLTSPDDLLETGVEIFVQLPGKKQQNLSLLSGGERALTAIALLFAFLKVRPAPFCLLDEVDAPLDGANIERFADLLRDFGGTTQFLVITHNPATMEAAHVWYGVTMQEPGISRVLSLQVPEPLSPVNEPLLTNRN